jgi:hypothetical protein
MKELRMVIKDVLMKLGRSRDDVSVLQIKGIDGRGGTVGSWEPIGVWRVQCGRDVFDLTLKVRDFMNLRFGRRDEVRTAISRALAQP